MSFKHTALALDHGPTDPLEKILLLALCDRADENGISFPSRADLLARTGTSTSTLTRKLRILEVKGWIKRQRRFNASNRFRVNFTRLEQLEAQHILAKQTFVDPLFEPFEDEITSLQPIENKGSAHCDHTSAHCDHTSAHSGPTSAHCAATNLPLNLSPKKNAAPARDPKAFSLFLAQAKPQESFETFQKRMLRHA